MATLCLDLEPDISPWRDLHDWLGGAWALLLSHPEDFQPGLNALRQEFKTRAVRVLAVSRDCGLAQAGCTQASWIDELRSDRQIVRLREPPFAAADPVAFAARALRGELLTAQSRFVMFIDGSLKRRQMLRYNAGNRGVTAVNLLATVDALRSHRSIGRAA
jgi:alkyl hydroperoxide reductase subunit AhpC